MSDAEIIQLIRNKEQTSALECLYRNYPVYKSVFIKSGGNASNAADIYQEALYILIQKISDEKFILSCSINSYLFGICKNLSHEYFRNKDKEVVIEFNTDTDAEEPDFLEPFIEEEKKYSALDKALIKIGERCISILSMFYTQQLSMAEIAANLGFRSEKSAKTQKYKCIEKARNLTLNVLSEIKAEIR